MLRVVRRTVVLCLLLAALPAAAGAADPPLSVDFTPNSLSIKPSTRLVTKFTSNHNGTWALHLMNASGVEVKRKDGRTAEGPNVVDLGTFPNGTYRLVLEAHWNGQEDGDVQPVTVSGNPPPIDPSQSKLAVRFSSSAITTILPGKTTARYTSNLAGSAVLALRRSGNPAIIGHYVLTMSRGTNKVALGKLRAGTYVLSLQARTGSQVSSSRVNITARKR
jgi:hypothetical protein